MKKRIISVLLVLTMIFSMMPLTSAFATDTGNVPASPIKVYVSIVDKGEVAIAQKKITVTDRDASGGFNVDEVLYAAHEAGFTGGAAAGYASEITAYGLSIKTLWGDTSGNFGYWLNDNSCWSLADTVVENDYLVAFVYQNTNVWDSYSKFSQKSYAAKAETAVSVSLEKAGYDENYNTVYSAHNSASLKVYDSSFNELASDKYSVSNNNDGTYSVTVKQTGNYLVVAYDNNTPIVPAIASIAVGENYENVANADHQAIHNATGNYIAGLGVPDVGSVGGEWMVINLTRSGNACPEGYYANVVTYVKENINDKEQLHNSKSTDNSRIILALTSAGYDVTDVDGHNLLMGLTDMTYVKKQGINGPILALIAFDSHGYEIPVNAQAAEQVTREGLISYILGKQLNEGGWAFFGTAVDPDITGMAIQALAPYYNTNADVKVAVDKELVRLSEKQLDNGGFGFSNTSCSESCAQVIVALTALGINPETDARFIKNGVSVVDAMCAFAVEGGGFAHTANGGFNAMATEQCQYALTSYFRLLNNKTSLYDMSDVTIRTKTDDNQNKGESDNQDISDENSLTKDNANNNNDTTNEAASLQTGDNSNIALYFILMSVSVFGLAALVVTDKKRKNL